MKVGPEDLHPRPRLLPRLPGGALGGGLPELQVPRGQRPRALARLDGPLDKEDLRLPPPPPPPSPVLFLFLFSRRREGVVDVGDDRSDHQQGVRVGYGAAAAPVADASGGSGSGSGGSGRSGRSGSGNGTPADARVSPPPFEPRDGELAAAPGAPLLRRSDGRSNLSLRRRRGRVAEARVEEPSPASAAVKGKRRRRTARLRGGGRGVHR